MASAGPMLTNREKAEITKYTEILGTDGEHHVEELIAKVENQAKGQPVVVMRAINEYITPLGNRLPSTSAPLILRTRRCQDRRHSWKR
jgi:hypothetical protein